MDIKHTFWQIMLIILVLTLDALAEPHLSVINKMMGSSISGMLQARPTNQGEYPGVVRLYGEIRKIDESGAVTETVLRASGVLINGCLLTAAHVLEEGIDEIEAYSSSGKKSGLIKNTLRSMRNDLKVTIGYDIAVIKLKDRLPDSHSADILETELEPYVFRSTVDWQDENIQKAVLKEGKKITVVSHGLNADFGEVFNIVPELPTGERTLSRAYEALRRRKGIDNPLYKKQVGSVRIAGEARHFTLAPLLDKVSDTIEKLEGDPTPQAQIDKLAIQREFKKLKADSFSYAVVPDPSYLMPGDSGGAAFSRKNKLAPEKLIGINSAIVDSNKERLIIPIARAHRWIMDQLEVLNCLDIDLSSPESMKNM